MTLRPPARPSASAASSFVPVRRRVGVDGATGMTGVELIRLLRQHPALELAWATSRRHAGATLDAIDPAADAIPLLAPEDVADDTPELVFVCLPHGSAAAAVARHRAAGARVVDLSGDLRLADPATHARVYGGARDEAIAASAVYGLTELARDDVRGADVVANPGCYPTCVGLALAPLAEAGALDDAALVVVDAKSGVSGAGREATPATHFCAVAGDVRPYKLGRVHRHVAEMEQLLAARGAPAARLVFNPHVVPFERGMLATCVVPGPLDAGSARGLIGERYAGEPFVDLASGATPARIRAVAGTNRAQLSVHDVEGADAVVIVSAIDNLGKGAAEATVQNANAMLGLPETLGLAPAGAAHAGAGAR